MHALAAVLALLLTLMMWGGLRTLAWWSEQLR